MHDQDYPDLPTMKGLGNNTRAVAYLPVQYTLQKRDEGSLRELHSLQVTCTFKHTRDNSMLYQSSKAPLEDVVTNTRDAHYIRG